MRRVRRIILLCAANAILAFAGLWSLYRASQSVPEFYELALELEAEQADKAGDELERQVVAMASDLEEGRRWELVLSDQQINGWLATDFVEKFPKLLPRDVQEPRVSFQDQTTSVACRIKNDKVSTVLSVKLDAYLTEQPNEIAVRVQRVRAGMLPVPLTKILDQITAAAQQSGISLRWTQQDGDPVALVALPVERPEIRPGVVLERLEIGGGELVVSGVADDRSVQTAEQAIDQSRLAESTSADAKNRQR
jgi:hypothetical protein